MRIGPRFLSNGSLVWHRSAKTSAPAPSSSNTELCEGDPVTTYGQYCPISRSAELLGDRWTIHIIRDLLTGTTRFNELISGNPGLSRALLSRRLQQLRRADVIAQQDDGTYRLTPAGRDLEPVVFGLATWGARWTFGEPEPEELDPDLLLWWLHRRLDASRLPGPRFTIAVAFTDHPKQYWIVVDPNASLCLADPRFEIDVAVRTDRSTLYRTYLGHVPLAESYRAGRVDLTGSRSAVRSFVDAFQPSPVASIVADEAPG
ncbi:MAG: transcriptional regulator [Acidimicrobiia bacterium]|nr:transcriptional regulator [Acidimicrobiia bacterium]